MNSKKLRRLILVAVLGSIATVLMKLNFPLPVLPPFLKIDFGEIPALIAVMTMGPVAGIGVEFIKNVLYWIMSGSPTGVPVGEIANFTTGLLFILPVYYIFNRVKTKKGLIAGLFTGTLLMAVGMSVLNYFVFLPMYTYFLGMDALVGPELYTFIVQGILPFNLLKGLILTLIMYSLYRMIQPWILRQQHELSI